MQIWSLMPRKPILSTSSGETISIEIADVVHLHVEACYKDQREKLPIVVTEGNGPGLLEA